MNQRCDARRLLKAGQGNSPRDATSWSTCEGCRCSLLLFLLEAFPIPTTCKDINQSNGTVRTSRSRYIGACRCTCRHRGLLRDCTHSARELWMDLVRKFWWSDFGDRADALLSSRAIACDVHLSKSGRTVPTEGVPYAIARGSDPSENEYN